MKWAAIALALGLAWAAPAGAQPGTTTVLVREGDTCEAIAEHLYGEGPEALETLHAANPELGPLPHHLVPGTTLRAPAPASIASTERVVELRPPAAEAFALAHPGDALARGTQVRTDEASSTGIAFRDGAEITVRERTLVIVYGGRRRLVERALTHAELERGTLRSRLGELASGTRVEIATPDSRATLAGAGVVSVEDDGTARIANHAARDATVTVEGTRVVVPPDSGVVVRRGERPHARRLLAAPRWLADQRGFAIGFVGVGATLRGGFAPVEGAAGYRVEIARDAEGRDVVCALELGAEASAFEAAGIVDPAVYVSVASIDADGLEGRRSPWRGFSVRLARLVSPGGLDADVTSASPPRVLPGTWLVAPVGLTCGTESEPASEILTLASPGRAAVLCGDASGVGARTPLDLEIVSVEAEVTGELVRDRSATLRLALAGEVLPPTHVLVVRGPEGWRVGRVHDAGGQLVVDVTAPVDAPDVAALELALGVGSSYVTLATLAVPVTSPPPLPSTEPEPRAPREPREPRAPHTVQSALGDLAWPAMLALRDERRGGLGAWVYGASVGGDGDPQIRLGGGAFAEVPEVPLRFSLATAGDVLGAVQPVDRRGSLDLVAGIGALVLDLPLVSVAVDLSGILPTRPEPESLGRARLAPTLELSVRPDPWVTLRTRQGALVDARDPGARLWSTVIGVDLTPERWVAVGVELDGSVGHFVDRDGAALALGLGAEARFSGLELALAGRFGLTDEARALVGAWSAVLSVRVFGR